MPTEGRMHAIGLLFSFHRDFPSCDHRVICILFLLYFVVDSDAFIYVVRVIFLFAG